MPSTIIKANKLGLVNIQLVSTDYVSVQSRCILLGVYTFEDVLRQAGGTIDYTNLYNKITPNGTPSNEMWYKLKSGDEIVYIADSWVATMSNIDNGELTNVNINIPFISEHDMNILKGLLRTLNIDYSL